MKNANRRVLAVGAHPDDVELSCSGTLKLLKERGYGISICIISNGDCGSMTESSKNITERRRAEALDAAKLLDAELYQVGEHDLSIEYNNASRRRVTEIIRTVDPCVVFTHPHEDYMSDHEITSRLVRDACFAASMPNYETYSSTPQARATHVPCLYYAAPMDGKDIYGRFIPQSIYVNITEVIHFKARMLACHESQREWLLVQHGIDEYIEYMKRTAQNFGKKIGCSYAEAFRQHLGNAYPQKNILKEILGESVVEIDEQGRPEKGKARGGTDVRD